MKKLPLFFALTLTAISLALTNAVVTGEKNTSEERSNIEAYNLDDTRIALRGYSPVSYFEKGGAERGKKEYMVDYRGIKYYFASEAQRQKFLKNPEKYEPAFGGWCAFGMSVEGRFRIDPEKFKIVNGRLYVFLNDIEVDAKALWEKDGDDDKLTRKAAAFWKKVSGENFPSS
ncbi:YHS domain-containing protein [candidate division KSB1 bacterium]|nr:YHS domain-containing protein [candidate division KSB1 bacterium]NIR70867.1 YHS domain-containing protein [candidate division KSB1 bacterium]NIS24653.1 YHS domain-containing protein [candidate division KSB1 bacterium]NIT71555.1 YHS domain-containing protein [candidate division KSB1 bacterium]NIU25253.1 YHS domain-containing protein [candidate division KSB1 bacterium]